MENIIGNYEVFWSDIYNRLKEFDIDITGCDLSHLGVRADSFELYEQMREKLMQFCSHYCEGVHNGRKIAKLVLKNPLILEGGFSVSLIELMPPKPNRNYKTGLEHAGVVIGKSLDRFAHKYRDKLTGRQNQSPICQPYFIKFDNEKRVKFYDISLRDVVEGEGQIFKVI